MPYARFNIQESEKYFSRCIQCVENHINNIHNNSKFCQMLWEKLNFNFYVSVLFYNAGVNHSDHCVSDEVLYNLALDLLLLLFPVFSASWTPLNTQHSLVFTHVRRSDWNSMRSAEAAHLSEERRSGLHLSAVESPWGGCAARLDPRGFAAPHAARNTHCGLQSV